MEKPDDLLGQILRHGPSQGTFFLVLKKMKQEGRHSEVIQECLKALGKYPEDINLRILLAESCFETGSVGQAEEELGKALLMIEDLISSYKLKAKIYMRQKRSEEAFDALKLFLVHNPQDQEALDLLEQVGQPKGDTDQAHHESTEDGETISSEIATSTLAEIYYNQGQINEAISTYKKVLSNNPDDNGSRVRLSELNALTKKGEDPRAENTDPIKLQKEKMIKILEKWQTNLQTANHGK